MLKKESSDKDVRLFLFYAYNMLDARGGGHRTKADAMRAAAFDGYTHATGSGCYWEGVRRIPAEYREG